MTNQGSEGASFLGAFLAPLGCINKESRVGPRVQPQGVWREQRPGWQCSRGQRLSGLGPQHGLCLPGTLRACASGD